MHIYFNPNFPLQKRSKIRRLLRRAATVTRRFFANSFIAQSVQDLLTRLDIYVTNSLNPDEMLDRRLTCSGESFDSGVIFLDFTKQVEFNRNEFIALIFHECIHGLRASLTTKNSDLDVSLFDYAINEGLAFKAERLLALNQSIARPAFLWPNKLSRSQLLDGLREMLRVEQSGEAWDFDDWFYNFTRRRPDFPKNFAYSIGEFVVDEFMRQKQLDFVSVLTTETSVLQQYAVMLMEKK